MAPRFLHVTPRAQRWIWGAHPRRTLVRAALLALALVVLGRWVWLPARVHGASMTPTLADGSWHVIARLRYHGRAPARGDVVALRMAGWRVMYIKRVLAVPGDTLAFAAGQLNVNGTDVPEPYVKFQGAWTLPTVALGPDEYFVAGDNRAMPIEEHAAGLVSGRRIAGGLWF